MNIAIIDDEQKIREEIEEIVLQYYQAKGNQAIHCIQFASGEEFLQQFKKGHYSIVFLDIELPGKNGIEVKERLEQEDGIYVLFLTGYGEFMQSAFGKNVCGFIEKPATLEKISFYLDKIEQYKDGEITIYFEDLQSYIQLSKIRYVKSENHYCKLFMDDGSILLTRTNIGELEERVVSHGFCRPHRSYIVNFNYVKCIKRNIICEDDTEIKIARGRTESIKRDFFVYMNRNGRCI